MPQILSQKLVMLYNVPLHLVVMLVGKTLNSIITLFKQKTFNLRITLTELLSKDPPPPKKKPKQTEKACANFKKYVLLRVLVNYVSSNLAFP